MSDEYRKDSSPKRLNWEKAPKMHPGGVGKSEDSPKVGKIEEVTNRKMVGSCG